MKMWKVLLVDDEEEFVTALAERLDFGASRPRSRPVAETP